VKSRNINRRGDIVRIFTRGIMFSAMLLLFVAAAMANNITVSGEISSNTTWQTVDDTVKVDGDITVNSGVTLTIEPGVTVQFQGDYLFTVDGILLSEGSIRDLADDEKADPDSDIQWVKFTQDTTGLDIYDYANQLWKDDSAGWDSLWRGIRFRGSDGGSSIKWTIVEFGYARALDDGTEWPYSCGGGIYVQSTSPTINRSIVRSCRASKFGGGIYLYTSNSDISNVVVSNNISDDSGGGIYMDLSTIELRNLTVHKNDAVNLGKGLFFGPDAIPNIRSSVISYNGNSFYRFYRPDSIFVGSGQNSESYFNVGQGTVAGQDIRNSALTDLATDDLATGNSSGYTQLGNFELIKFVDNYYHLIGNSSVAVDNGDANDVNSLNEPRPNGGQLGSRINSGAWGGTKLASKSIAVAVPCRADGSLFGNSTFVGFNPVEPNPDPIASAAVYIKNIGGGELIFRPEYLEWREVSGDSINTGRAANEPYLYWDENFTPFSVKPDSIGYFEMFFNPDFDYDPNTANGVPDSLAYDMNNWLVISTENETFEYRIAPLFFNPGLILDPVGTNPSFDFLDVEMGEVPASRAIVLTNNGTTNVTTLDFSDLAHFRMSPADGQTVIEPDSSHSYFFTCVPSRYNGQVEETLTITSNDDPISLDMRAFVSGAILDVFPESESLIEYAFVNQNATRSRRVEIQNSGNLSLRVDSIRFSDPAFTSTTLFDGALIPMDSTHYDTIAFTPVSLMPYEATVSIYFNTDDIVEYELTGRGTRPGVYFSGIIPQIVDGVAEVPRIWGDSLNVNGDVVDSVYVCAGPTTIPAGQSIIIRPGVTVYFDDPYEDMVGGPNFIQIEGKLEVLGTEDNKVNFLPLPNNVDGSHSGLRFLACDPGSRIENAVIENSISWTVAEIVTYLELSPTNNSIDQSSPHILAHGGGIALYNCSPHLTNVEIRNNTSIQDGGGLWSYQGEPLITNCYIHENLAVTGGGAVFVGGRPLFHANRVISNVASGSGGGIHITSNSVALITNSIINTNESADHGSAILIDAGSAPLLLNNVILSNTTTSSNGDGVYVTGSSQPQIINSVIRGHLGDQILVENSSPIVNYSLIEGGYADIPSVNPDAPEWDPVTFEPTSAINNNLVDQGNPSGQYEDFSFPPSLGEITADIGIFGGPFAGNLGDAKLKILIFADLANRSNLYIVESVVGTAISAQSIAITTVGNTVVYNSSNGLEAVPNVDGIWRLSYTINEPSYLDIVASATVDGIDYSTRRSLSATIFKPSSGGNISNPSGARLIIPPNAVATEMRIVAESELSAEMPEESNGAIEAGSRWNIKSDLSQWSKEAEIILPYNESVVIPGSELGLSIWRQIDDDWTRLESYVETGSSTVHASTKKSGTFIVLYEKTSENSSYLPNESLLDANYPNPFNPTTTIPFRLNGATRVKISVFNVLGQKVATVVNGWYTAGQHRVVWDSKDELGRSVASGLYLYRMETTPANGSSGLIQTRKLVLMR
jgi:predicted outer membrane repeat protein